MVLPIDPFEQSNAWNSTTSQTIRPIKCGLVLPINPSDQSNAWNSVLPIDPFEQSNAWNSTTNRSIWPIECVEWCYQSTHSTNQNAEWCYQMRNGATNQLIRPIKSVGWCYQSISQTNQMRGMVLMKDWTAQDRREVAMRVTNYVDAFWRWVPSASIQCSITTTKNIHKKK